jgi:hypothetical protein
MLWCAVLCAVPLQVDTQETSSRGISSWMNKVRRAISYWLSRLELLLRLQT